MSHFPEKVLLRPMVERYERYEGVGGCTIFRNQTLCGTLAWPPKLPVQSTKRCNIRFTCSTGLDRNIPRSLDSWPASL